MNLDWPRSQLDDFAVPRQIIGALALHLDGGIARRGLLDQAGKLRQQAADRLRARPDIAGLHDLPLGVVGVALLSPAHREAVALAAVHHERNGLGGFAKRDREAAGGERIERAGMAGALGLKQPLHHRDGLRRRHADRLVQHDPAVNVAPVTARLIVGPPLLAGAGVVVAPRILTVLFRIIIFLDGARFGVLRPDLAVCGSRNHEFSSESGARSLCTAGVRSNFSIRSASSNRSSTRKRISGANFKLTRCATSPRRNFLLRSSAAITTSVSRPPSGIT